MRPRRSSVVVSRSRVRLLVDDCGTSTTGSGGSGATSRRPSKFDDETGKAEAAVVGRSTTRSSPRTSRSPPARRSPGPTTAATAQRAARRATTPSRASPTTDFAPGQVYIGDLRRAPATTRTTARSTGRRTSAASPASSASSPAEGSVAAATPRSPDEGASRFDVMCPSRLPGGARLVARGLRRRSRPAPPADAAATRRRRRRLAR